MTLLTGLADGVGHPPPTTIHRDHPRADHPAKTMPGALVVDQSERNRPRSPLSCRAPGHLSFSAFLRSHPNADWSA